jgi:hypothetical protein
VLYFCSQPVFVVNGSLLPVEDELLKRIIINAAFLEFFSRATWAFIVATYFTKTYLSIYW